MKDFLPIETNKGNRLLVNYKVIRLIEPTSGNTFSIHCREGANYYGVTIFFPCDKNKEFYQGEQTIVDWLKKRI